MYQHSGSENFHDSFTIRISDQSDSNSRDNTSPKIFTIVQQLNITIKRIDDEVPILLVSEPLVVTPGRKRCLDSSNLQVTDSDTNIENLQYIVRSTSQYGEFSLKLSENAETVLSYGDIFDQSDVDKGRVCYLASMDVAEDTEQLVMDISDGTNILRGQTFNASIKSTFEIGLNITVILNNNEGDGIYKMTMKHFQISDITLDRKTLWFKVSKFPTHGDVKILRDKIFKPSEKFSVSDLSRDLVIYYHDITYDETMDSFQLQLVQEDLYYGSSYPSIVSRNRKKVLRTFDVAVIDPEKRPILVSLGPITVYENSSRVISNDDINVQQDDKLLSVIEFLVNRNPTFGELKSKSQGRKQLLRFSMNDLTKGDIYYRHLGRDVSKPTEDLIGVQLTDPRRPSDDCSYYLLPDSTYPTKRNLMLRILLIPIDNRAPKIYVNSISTDIITRSNNRSVSSGQRYGHFSVVPLSSVNLRASDEDSSTNEIIYSVRNSSNGFVCLNQLTDYVANFTQAQLDKGLLGFCLPIGYFETDGKFDFTLQDASKSAFCKLT